MSIKKGFIIVCSMVCSLFVAGFLYQAIACYRDNIAFPAPGKLVDVGGYKLHVQEFGSGMPTVVMDAGTGSFSLMWQNIPQDIAQYTHVYTYDKGGLGWSDESPLPRTSKNMAQELHTLLEKMNAPKPYILVGHSLGGGTIQLFTDLYPNEVFGLVIVDGGHEGILDAMKEQGLMFQRTMTGFTAVHTNGYDMPDPSFINGLFIKIMRCPWGSRFIEWSGLKRLYLTWFYTTPHHAQYPMYPQLLSRLLRPSAFCTTSQEIAGYPQSAQELKEAPEHLRDKPLIVISAGRGFFYNPLNHEVMTAAEIEFNEKVWAPLQADLAKKSIHGRQIIAHNSGHRIQDTEPELIVDAIRELVEEYKKSHEGDTL